MPLPLFDPFAAVVTPIAQSLPEPTPAPKTQDCLAAACQESGQITFSTKEIKNMTVIAVIAVVIGFAIGYLWRRL